jgi:hypothetical protein
VLNLTTFQWVTALGGAAYVVVGAVNTMPKPPAPGERLEKGWAYRWMYDWTHMLLNSPAGQRLEQRIGFAEGAPAPPAAAGRPGGAA